MMIPDRKGITHGRFMWAVRKYHPTIDYAKTAHIVQELMAVWTFADKLPDTVQEMRFHGME
jgi:hypothetical protein